MIKKYLSILLLPIILLYAIPPLSAQDAPAQYVCDLPTLQKTVDVYIDALQQLKDSKETDPAKISNTLQEMSNVANLLRSSCDNLAFTGKGKKALGPFEVPSGTYRATLTTPSDGYVGANVTLVDGKCGAGSTDFLSPLLFNTAGGEAKDGTETLFFSGGCTILIQLDIDNSQWDMKFERITVN